MLWNVVTCALNPDSYLGCVGVMNEKIEAGSIFDIFYLIVGDVYQGLHLCAIFTYKELHTSWHYVFHTKQREAANHFISNQLHFMAFGWRRKLNSRPCLSITVTTVSNRKQYLVTDLDFMMTSSNGNIFRGTGHLSGEFTGHRWIPHTKTSDGEL